MPEFISLQDFLGLADPIDTKWFRSVWRIRLRPEHWPKLYALAKASFEQYGEAGPPVGCTVMTLQPGHGGGTRAYRTFRGIWTPRDERYFFLTRPSDRGEDDCSLVSRACWWTDIMVVPDNHDNHQYRWLDY